MRGENSEAPTTCNSQGLDLSATLSESTDMKIIANKELAFHSTVFTPVVHSNQIWLTATELAKALEYKKADAVTQIYARNSDEFSSCMSTTLKLRVVRKTGDVDMMVRCFSLRGAHLVAMFATTKVAKDFRKWVLDILDKEVDKRPEVSPLYRYKAKLILLDEETGDKFEILGKAMDLRTVAYGLASDLGYRPNAFTHVPVNPKKLRKIH